MITGEHAVVYGYPAQYAGRLAHGIRLTINSQIDPTLGLGSSAAVTAATLAALNFFVHQDVPTGAAGLHQRQLGDLHRTGLAVIRELQGRGSGADLAASLCGGMLAYQLPKSVLAGAQINEQQKYLRLYLLRETKTNKAMTTYIYKWVVRQKLLSRRH